MRSVGTPQITQCRQLGGQAVHRCADGLVLSIEGGDLGLRSAVHQLLQPEMHLPRLVAGPVATRQLHTDAVCVAPEDLAGIRGHGGRALVACLDFVADHLLPDLHPLDLHGAGGHNAR